jgi:two-component system chemotaxis response regulator CheB
VRASRTPARVVICDASAAFAETLSGFLEAGAEIAVVGRFTSAPEMLAQLDALRPDLITIDLGLPGMGGLAAIERTMSHRPVPILVLSSEALDGGKAAACALAAGALEAMDKARLRLDEPVGARATALRSRVRRLASVRLSRHLQLAPASLPAVAPRPLGGPFAVVGIGASTGGPPALIKVLGALPADFPLPVLVVQHILAGFGDGLLSLLAQNSALPVAVARDRALATAGVWLAPEGCHLALDPAMRFELDHDTCRGAHRPSIDVLFESLARSQGRAALAVILTGMGRDGAEGVAAIAAAGGTTIAQDEGTSAVFGMPRAAIDAGAGNVLALTAIGPALAHVECAGVAS